MRCVDRILCNRTAIARLANRICRELKVTKRFCVNEVVLEDVHDFCGYGKTFSGANEVTDLFRDAESIILDSTYTSKVAYHMQMQIQNQKLQHKDILYWHTFSPHALEH